MNATVDTRPLMASFPTGVAIVTAMDEENVPCGMTCTSLCSVSLHPPTLLVCLRSESQTLRAVRAHARFALNLLHDQATSAAKLFASGTLDRFDRIGWRLDKTCGGPHLPGAAHTIADCQVIAEHEV